MPHSYARAKFIGEGMLAMASAEMGMGPWLSVIGQISGDADATHGTRLIVSRRY